MEFESMDSELEQLQKKICEQGESPAHLLSEAEHIRLAHAALNRFGFAELADRLLARQVDGVSRILDYALKTLKAA